MLTIYTSHHITHQINSSLEARGKPEDRIGTEFNLQTSLGQWSEDVLYYIYPSPPKKSLLIFSPPLSTRYAPVFNVSPGMDMDILFCHVQLMKTMVMIRMPGIWKGGDGVNDHEEDGDNDESDDEDEKMKTLVPAPCWLGWAASLVWPPFCPNLLLLCPPTTWQWLVCNNIAGFSKYLLVMPSGKNVDSYDCTTYSNFSFLSILAISSFILLSKMAFARAWLSKSFA